jgi:RNA methyltransferase, TrmH family
MIEIESKDNLKIKHLRKLNQKKYRDEHSEFLVENFVTIKDAFQSGFKAKQIFITSKFLSPQTGSRSAGEKNKAEIEEMLVEETYLIDERINESFSNLNTSSGICAVYEKLDTKVDFKKPIIYLNNISDPGNLGTILRSALAFDLKNIVLDEKCVDLYNYKVINASKDSIFKLNIKIDKDLVFLKEIKEKMKVFSTRLEESSGLEVLKKEYIFCLVLGSESHGVSKEIQDLSDNFVKISMGNEIESLNVSGAAAIIFNYIHNK